MRLSFWDAIETKYSQTSHYSGHLKDLYLLCAEERYPLYRGKIKRKAFLTDKKPSEMSVRYSEVSRLTVLKTKLAKVKISIWTGPDRTSQN